MRGVIVGMVVLVPSIVMGQEADRPASEQYEALALAYKAAMDGWDKRFDIVADAKAPEAYKEARYRDWPGWAFAPRFLRLAELHPKDPAAMDALNRVVSEMANSVGENDILLAPHFDRALELLVRDHLDDDRLGELCKNVGRRLSASSEAFLRTVLEKSRSRVARGQACLGLARLLAGRAEVAAKPWFEDKEQLKDPFNRFLIARWDPGFFRYVRETRRPEANAEAIKLFEKAIKDYGDVRYWQDPDDPARRTSVGEFARELLNELRAKAGEGQPGADGEPAGRPPG